jgi:hypothetical protein
MKKVLMISLILLVAIVATAVTARAKEIGRVVPMLQDPVTLGVQTDGVFGVAQSTDTFYYGGTEWDAGDARWQASAPAAAGWANRKMWTWNAGGFAGTPHSGLNMDGWVGVDRTADVADHFHVQDGTTIGACATSKVLFCGLTNAECTANCYGDLNGTCYGDNWNQMVVSPSDTFNVGDALGLTYDYANETEPEYDFTYVVLQVYDWIGLAWIDHATLATYDGLVSGTEVIDLASKMPGACTWRILFRFQSDVAWSDEDGMAPTACGAVAFDNVAVTGAVTWSENFETTAIGALPAGWSKYYVVGCGDFARVMHIDDLTTPDSCGIADSVIVLIDPTNPLYPHPLCQDNFVESPLIDFSARPGMPGRVLTIERFGKLSISDHIFMHWRVKYYPCCADSGWSPWLNDGYIYYTREVGCAYWTIDVSAYIPPTAVSAKIGLGVVNHCDLDPWGIGCTYVCNETPYYDNVTFGVFGEPGATPPGTDVVVVPEDPATGTFPVTLSFAEVTEGGQTSLEILETGTPPPFGFELGSPPTYYELSTTASYTGPVEICIDYNTISFVNEDSLRLFHLEDDQWVDRTVSLDTETNVICAEVSSLSEFAVLERVPPATVAGTVTADCPTEGSPLYGVTIDVYEEGTGDLVAGDVTDESGGYAIENLEAGHYIVTIVTPLGYTTEPVEVPTTIEGVDVTMDFSLTCVEVTAQPRSMGFWKHQVGVATGGQGNAQVDATTLCDYLDIIEAHFNTNAINQVVVYQPPASGECVDKLEVAKTLLNLKGSVAMVDRAKQQLTALLLNVAAQHLGLMHVISEDGATVSQAITYCDGLIDDGIADNDEVAKSISDMINDCITVPEGMIPLTTPEIAYSTRSGRTGVPSASYLSQGCPNPFNPSTVIEFGLATDCHVRLSIYNVGGQEIRTLVDDNRSRGHYSVFWDGTDNSGRPVSGGVYFSKIVAGDYVEVGKLVVLK